MAAIAARRLWIILPVSLVMALTLAWLMSTTPQYRSSARVLVESQESGFTLPERSTPEARALDQEQIRSQVQVILSNDLARTVIRGAELAQHSDFQSSAGSIHSRLMSALGLARSAARNGAEDRLLDAYYRRLGVYPVDGSRVIAIEFSSSDPELAARVANAVGDAYIEMQREAKRDTTVQASAWLGTQIDTLRRNVQDAEQLVEEFRRTHSLYAAGGGAEPRSLSEQQLAELSSQLAAARAEKSDAQARARMIRGLLEAGGALESSDILSSPLIQSLEGDRARLQAQLAESSSTLGPRHPRIRQISAETASLNQQIRAEAEKIVRSLENDARVASEREEQLLANLDTQMVRTADSNEREVELRALERDARTQRELLESMQARFGEASVRDTIAALPADARLISRALPAQSPYFPRSIPILVVVFLATTMVSAGVVLTLELMRQVSDGAQTPHVPRALVAMEHDHGSELLSDRGGYVDAGSRLANLARSIVEAAAAAPQIAVFTSVRRVDTLPRLCMEFARHAAGGDRRVVVVDTAFGEGLTDDVVGGQLRGLGELLAGRAAFESVLVRDPLSRVHVVPAGDTDADPLMLVSSERMDLTLVALGQTYDIVIMLAPTVNRSAEARVLARRANVGILVTSGFGDDAVSARARERLYGAGIETVALVNLHESDLEGVPDETRAA